MGKRVKKKSRVPPPKEKRVVVHSPKVVPQQSNPNVETVDDGVPVVKERKLCAHIDKGIDLEKLSAKIGSSDPVRCEDCREGSNDRRGGKGKGKHGKKKGSASVDSKSESKAIWVCLECGHFACGGVGLPTTTQSHAVRHVRQHRHPLVIQWENPHLRWCFPCNTLIPVEKIEENGESKDALSDVVKLIKGRATEVSKVDVEDVWFGSGSVMSVVKPEGTALSGLEGRGGYVVRGLSNLGNTCFFNSVMQNLLAMDRLRDYFLNQDVLVGPLTIALKKLYAETKLEAGLRNVISPRSLFGCLCSKAPQFRGYQQHDSHELLRCLLDGLFTEEASARKQINSSQEDGTSSSLGPTFVDSVFGGQISSTVCCVECGHYSTVYEPFLDLSLPVPTKKPPLRKAQAVARGKKTKLPPKRGGRIRSKVNKDAYSVPAQTISNPSASSESPSIAQSTVPLAEKISAFSNDSTLPDSVGSTTVTDESGSVSQSIPGVPESESEQAFENTAEQAAASLDAWLDYLGPETISDEPDLTSQYNDLSFIEDSGGKDMVVNDTVMESSRACSLDGEPNLKPDSSFGNPWEDELPLQVQDSEVLLLPYKEESSTAGQTIKGEAEASSSVVSCGQEEVDFDGFGDLFNEPEIAAGPILGPSLGNEVAGTGVIAGNISDSDPDEVDDTDSPVSVESCLVHFIKPELLSNDNAWDCENCAKIMQKLEAKRKAKKTSKNLTNDGQTKSQSDSQSLDKEISGPTEVTDISNGEISTDIALNNPGECIVSQNGKIDLSNQNCKIMENGQTGELSKVVSQCKEGIAEMNNAVLEQSDSSDCYKSCNQESVSDQATASCSVDEPSSIVYTPDKSEQSDSQLLENHESEESEHEEMNHKGVKVKRDATKRVLINKAPPILTIHLKRFSQDGRGRLTKLNGHVNFRETIDLRPYMDPRCIDQEQYVYHLVGVVEHLGTMRGGHYVAYVRGEKSRGKAEKDNGGSVWYHTSDAYVREVSLDEVLRCEAYILFYEKN